MIIKDLNLRKIIDSRGNPTVEADIVTNEGFGRAAAPAGASTGTFEAQAWPIDNVDLGMKVKVVYGDALGRKDKDGNSYMSYFFEPA